MTRILLLIACLLMTLGSQAASLDELINARLDHMKDVASHKWQHGLPIEDTAREQVVIESAELRGLRYGIRRSATRAFFSAQIDAAKEVQRHWFAQWQKSAPSGTAPDLVTETHPALLALGDEIMRSLGDRDASRTLAITVAGVTPGTAARLQTVASAVSYYESPFNQVLRFGILRVGTTGDYAPFSWGGNGRYEGIDIDLALDLADSLDAELVLVKTSWPSLINDLLANRFDIAMSGVSRSLPRARFGVFSSAYHVGGKTPIARCKDRRKYSSLERIDREGVRVIVNPGGTNEAFVESQLQQATIVRHPENVTVFDEIRDKRADVMFTDAIEVQVKAKTFPDLCATMPGKTLTYQEKGYLLQPDLRWQSYVNQWLAQRQGDGTVDAAFARHLSGKEPAPAEEKSERGYVSPTRRGAAVSR